jgi:hypothetical protein
MNRSLVTMLGPLEPNRKGLRRRPSGSHASGYVLSRCMRGRGDLDQLLTFQELPNIRQLIRFEFGWGHHVYLAGESSCVKATVWSEIDMFRMI